MVWNRLQHKTQLQNCKQDGYPALGWLVSCLLCSFPNSLSLSSNHRNYLVSQNSPKKAYARDGTGNLQSTVTIASGVFGWEGGGGREVKWPIYITKLVGLKVMRACICAHKGGYKVVAICISWAITKTCEA